MKRFNADSWVQLATARAAELESVVTGSDDIPLHTLEVTDCSDFKRVKLDEVLRDRKSLVIFLRHFA